MKWALICLGGGIAMAVVLILWETYVTAPPLPQKWVLFFFFTALLVGLSVYWYWGNTSIKLWILLCCLLGVHVLAFGFFLALGDSWPTLAYFLTLPAEAMAIVAITYRALGILPPESRTKPWRLW